MIATMAMPQLSSDKRIPHLRRIAIFQIISGGLSLALGIISVIWFSMFEFQVGSGIWAGLCVIVTGIVGYRTIKKNIHVSGAVTYTAYLVMNILSSVLIGVAISFTSVTSAHSMYWIDRYCSDGDWWCNILRSNARAARGASLILAINLSAVFFASIVASAFCCICCGRTMNPRVGNTVGTVSNQQPGVQVAAPIQYHQQPQITAQQEGQQPVIQQQQPIMIQQPMMQPQPMIFQQPMMQQPFLLQQVPLSAPQQQPPQQPPPQQQPPQQQPPPQQPQQQLQQDQQHGQWLEQPKPHQEHHQEVPDLPEYSP